MNMDEECLIQADNTEEKPDVVVYTRRWYILAVFCLIAASQGGIWNNWGPIADSAEKVFGWDDGTIGLMVNWGPIAYLFSMPLFTWLMDVKGLRLPTVLSMAVLTVGAGLRCVPAGNTVRTVLIHIGQLLNGIPGPLCMAAPPLLSSVWFPVSQRTTATAIGAMFGGLGMTAPFIIGPYIVQDLSNKTVHNESTTFNDNFQNELLLWQNNTHNDTESDIEKMKKEINLYMYITFGWCLLLMLMVVLYFPSKPPSPPSITASVQRLDYISGIKKLARNKKFWTLGMVYGLSLGVYFCFMSVIEVLLKQKNISQDDAGWLGFYCGIVGNLVTLLVAGFADMFKRRMKLFIVTLYVCAAISFAVCSISYSGWLIPFNKVTAYATQLVGAICMTAGSPLFFELSCEVSYPVAEGITNGVLTWLNNISGLIFLFVLMIPGNDKSWMVWSVTGSIVLCLPFLLLLKARFGRLDVDTQVTSADDCD